MQRSCLSQLQSLQSCSGEGIRCSVPTELGLPQRLHSPVILILGSQYPACNHSVISLAPTKFKAHPADAQAQMVAFAGSVELFQYVDATRLFPSTGAFRIRMLWVCGVGPECS